MTRASRAPVFEATMLAACRWQYIVGGVQDRRFGELLASMIGGQGARIHAALAPIAGASLQ